MSWSLFPLFHGAVFGLTAVLLRILLRYRASAVWPLVFSRADTAVDLTARCFYLWLPLADLAYVLAYAWTAQPGPLLLAGASDAPALRTAGAAMLAAALAWVLAAQASMGQQWKMGVDPVAKGALCSSGLFARSRHPVYAGIRLTMLGQLLVIGSWPMLCLWLLSELLVQLQARFEEAAMQRAHGDGYRNYCARVRRWL